MMSTACATLLPALGAPAAPLAPRPAVSTIAVEVSISEKERSVC